MNMRIKNVTHNNGNPNPTNVKITLPRIGGGYEQIDLPPDHSVYGEIMDNNSSLRIYIQKRFIEIVDGEEKPDNIEYYIPYRNDAIEEVYEIVQNDIDNYIKDEINEEAEETEELKEVSLPIEVEILVPESSIKNKGGRPKGAKNKPKRGPKKKKK